MDILSWSWALSSFNGLIMLIISLLSNLIQESLVFVFKFGFQEFYCLYLNVYIDLQKKY